MVSTTVFFVPTHLNSLWFSELLNKKMWFLLILNQWQLHTFPLKTHILNYNLEEYDTFLIYSFHCLASLYGPSICILATHTDFITVCHPSTPQRWQDLVPAGPQFLGINQGQRLFQKAVSFWSRTPMWVLRASFFCDSGPRQIWL